MKGKKKLLSTIIVSLIAALLIFIPAVATPQNTEAAEGDLVTVSITPTFHQSEARAQLDLINEFRASNPGYKNEKGETVYNGAKKELVYDYTLEEYAMQRAAEIIFKFEHDRPAGGRKSGLFGYATGENIGRTINNKGNTADYSIIMFKEDNKDYKDQGHRRMMLSVPCDFDAVGIACAEYEGGYYWVQIFGGCKDKYDTEKRPPVNGKKQMYVDIINTYITNRVEKPINVYKNEQTCSSESLNNIIEINYGIDENNVAYTTHSGILFLEVPGTWKPDNEKIVKVEKSGNEYFVKPVGNGTTEVKLIDKNEKVIKTVKVTSKVVEKLPDEVQLDKNSTTINTGDPETLIATVLPDNATNKTVTWKSSNTAVATVDKNGNIKTIKAGKTNITATTVNGKTATCEVTVKDIAPTGLKLNKTATKINTGYTDKLTATVEPSNATNKTITWTSSNKAVATVDKNGTVKGIKEGVATITAKTVNGKTATCKVTVEDIIPTGVELGITSASIEKDSSVNITATVSPSDATNKNVTWTSSDTKVATVDKNGSVKAISKGTATITCKTVAGGKTATCKVTVVIPETGVTLNKTSTTIKKGRSKTITATVNPTIATNKKVTWLSSDEKIAKVDVNGKITAINYGTATITAKTVNGKTAKCKVIVPVPVSGVKLNKSVTTINIGATETLIATVSPSNAANKNVTWTSSNTKIAKVDKNGKVTGMSAGTVTITCKTVDGGKTATCKVNVDGWINANNKYSYLKEGKKLIGFYYFTSKEGEKTPHWSYFDKNGVMLTGWQWLGKGTSNPDGDKAKHMSYFGDNGWLRTGWQQMGKGTSNSFDENTNTHWSYFGDNGWLRTGWQQMGKGTNNSFDENTNKHWSYFGENGWLRTGWVKFGKGTSEPDGNSTPHWSYFGDNGWMRTGWQEMGKGTQNSYNENTNKHYSFFGDNGWMRTGKQTINKKIYTFNGNGWLTNPTKP